MHRDELARYLDQLLDAGRFRDYCPNGLQVEGRERVRTIVTGVSANLELLEQAVAAEADAVLVHHGYFWRGEDGRLTGGRKRRVAFLLAHELNLYAYHLPLDAHPALGNNAQLALRLGLHQEACAGEQDLVSVGRLVLPCSLEQLTADIGLALKRTPLVVGEGGKRIERVAWCTGGAQNYFEEVVRLGVDAYITGEVSERHVHHARESGVAFISAGHHATERFGVQALGAHLASELGLAHRFIEIPNPV